MPPSKDFFERTKVAVDMCQPCHDCWSVGFRRSVDTFKDCEKCFLNLTRMLCELVAEQIGREQMEKCPKCSVHSS